MTTPRRFHRAEALETAIELTKRLQDSGDASLVGIDSSPDATTVHLSLPADGLRGVRRLRRRLWTSFVHRNVVRRDHLRVENVRSLERRRDAVVNADRQVERVRRYLTEHDGVQP